MRQMEERLSQFQSVSPAPGSPVIPGNRVLEWRPRANLACYVMLHIRSDHDAFTIEAAWSRNGQFPSRFRYLCPRDWPRHKLHKDRPIKGEFHFRLCRLWEPKDDIWWKVSHESVEAVVRDAIERIVKYGLPYFDEISSTQPPRWYSLSALLITVSLQM